MHFTPSSKTKIRSTILKSCATEKLCNLIVLTGTVGHKKRHLLSDQRNLGVECQRVKSLILDQAWPLWALRAISEDLNWILRWRESKWKAAWTGIICSYFLAQVSIIGAPFGTKWWWVHVVLGRSLIKKKVLYDCTMTQLMKCFVRNN